MRIGIDATCLPTALAGAGRYIRGLITGLVELDTAHEFVIFLKESDRTWFQAMERPNVKFVTIPCSIRPTRLFWEIARTPRVIEHFRFDVWHAPHYIMPLTTGSCKTVVTFHDMAFHIFPELFPITKRWTFRWALARASHTADRIIATSQATKDETAHVLHVDPDRITVVHHGIDPSFQPVENLQHLEAIRKRYGIPGPYILMVGTIDRRKNIHTLIQAYHLLVQDNAMAYPLVIAGQRGNGYAELIREITSRGLTDRIHLLGYVDEETLPGLYSGARLFVSPSRYEGFGFPALEALACGTPVLSSPSPSITEIPTRGVEIVADPFDVHAWRDRLEAALSEPRGYDQPVIARQQWIETHSWEGVAEKTIGVYEAAAGQEAPLPTRSSWREPVTALPSGRFVSDACIQAVLRTIAYADLFDYPLTAQEIHQGLIEFRATRDQVDAALRSPELSDIIAGHDRWFILKGRERLVRERAQRSTCTAVLFQQNHPILRWLCACPFVQMVALSGATAFENCREDSDIDLFMIVDARRIWSTYALLAAVAKLLGKRDLLCMNYLIGRSDYHIDDHDFYTAHQIASLQPLYGWDRFRRFTASNGWVMNYLPQWHGHSNGTRRFQDMILPKPISRIKRGIELVLGLPLLSPIEWMIYRVYGRRLMRKVKKQTNSDVRLSRDHIKLHTNDHSRRVLGRFERRVADVLKMNERIGESANRRI